MSIYVGNLPHETSEEAVRDLFSNHGSVSSIKLINDRETGRFRGFGFIEMSSSSEESTAIEALDGKDFNGRNLKVNPARSK